MIENAPRVLKLFANRTSLGFSDAGDIEPTQTIELTDDDFESSKEIELRFVKFQRVKSVTVSVCIITIDDPRPIVMLTGHGFHFSLCSSSWRRTMAQTRPSSRASSSLVRTENLSYY